jgi:hypothetical protein
VSIKQNLLKYLSNVTIKNYIDVSLLSRDFYKFSEESMKKAYIIKINLNFTKIHYPFIDKSLEPYSAMPTRIIDIAKAAGVSPSAVPPALNNKSGVSGEVRDRILGIAKTMGCRSVIRQQGRGRGRRHQAP